MQVIQVVDEFNLPAIQLGIDPGQFCRSCERQDNRINVSQEELTKVKQSGGDITRAMCQPDKSGGLIRVHKDKSISDTHVVPVSIRSTQRNPDKNVMGLVETCGQKVLEKCRTCARFNAVVVRIPGGTNASGRMWFRSVTVGGHCRIGPQGIAIGNQIVHCDKKPILDVLEEQRSCSTCRWRGSFNNDTMLDHVTPLYHEITTYEMDQVREDAYAAGARGQQIGTAIAQARRIKGQIRFVNSPHNPATSLAFFGLKKTYLLPIVQNHVTEDVITAISVRTGMGDVYRFELSEDRDTVGVISIVSPTQALLEITSPFHRNYGLPDNDRIRHPMDEKVLCPKCHAHKNITYRDGRAFPDRYTTYEALDREGRWEWIECGRCGGSGRIGITSISTVSLVQRDLADRVHRRCLMCGAQPCTWHAKKPLKREETILLPLINGVMETNQVITEDCQDPNGTKVIRVQEDKSKDLRLHRHENGVTVLDHNNNPPSYFVFRIWYRSIISWCKTKHERNDVLRQFGEAKQRVKDHEARDRQVDLSWNRPTPVDPWHPYCGVNLYDSEWREGRERRPPVRVKTPDGFIVETLARGIDFTQEWNDQFGTVRGEMSTNPVVQDPIGQLFGLEGKPMGGPHAAGLRRDDKFSWTKWQENEDWLRITEPGDILFDEYLSSFHHLREGQKTHERCFETPCPQHSWLAGATKHTIADTDFTVIDMGTYGIPGTAQEFDSAQELMDWLDETIWIPGNDEAAGFMVTNRWNTLGYEQFKNTKVLMADDIPSVYYFNHHMAQPDASEPDQESPSFFACTECYDPTAGDAGRFSPEEVDKTDSTCLNPDCGGTLMYYHTQEEWEAGHMQTDSDTIEDWENYRRRSGASNSSSWEQSQRLMNSVCPFWSRRVSGFSRRRS